MHFILSFFWHLTLRKPRKCPEHHAQSDRYWADLAQSYPAFEVDPSKLRVAAANVTISLGDLQFGVAGTDTREGSGYIMYSEENVHTRFFQ